MLAARVAANPDVVSHLGGAILSVDVTSFVVASPAVRAAVSFAATVLFGGGIIYRYGHRLDDAVEASTAHPLQSVVYGVTAYGLGAFFALYAYSRLAVLGVGQGILSVLFAITLGVLVLSLGGLGFVVVGLWTTEVVGVEDPWMGLVGVGGLSALAWFVFPFAVGVAVWVGIAAVGIGGPTRRWVHSSAAE
jgi:hypothetical protein